MSWTLVLALVACAVGGGLGLYAMSNPGWASRLVALVPEEGRVEGRSEFRATYGGLFVAGHAFAAGALLANATMGGWSAAALGAGWLGSAGGRLVSFLLDGATSRLNVINVAVEAALGLGLLAPLIAASA